MKILPNHKTVTQYKLEENRIIARRIRWAYIFVICFYIIGILIVWIVAKHKLI